MSAEISPLDSSRNAIREYEQHQKDKEYNHRLKVQGNKIVCYEMGFFERYFGRFVKSLLYQESTLLTLITFIAEQNLLEEGRTIKDYSSTFEEKFTTARPIKNSNEMNSYEKDIAACWVRLYGGPQENFVPVKILPKKEKQEVKQVQDLESSQLADRLKLYKQQAQSYCTKYQKFHEKDLAGFLQEKSFYPDFPQEYQNLRKERDRLSDRIASEFYILEKGTYNPPEAQQVIDQLFDLKFNPEYEDPLEVQTRRDQELEIACKKSRLAQERIQRQTLKQFSKQEDPIPPETPIPVIQTQDFDTRSWNIEEFKFEMMNCWSKLDALKTSTLEEASQRNFPSNPPRVKEELYRFIAERNRLEKFLEKGRANKKLMNNIPPEEINFLLANREYLNWQPQGNLEEWIIAYNALELANQFLKKILQMHAVWEGKAQKLQNVYKIGAIVNEGNTCFLATALQILASYSSMDKTLFADDTVNLDQPGKEEARIRLKKRLREMIEALQRGQPVVGMLDLELMLNESGVFVDYGEQNCIRTVFEGIMSAIRPDQKQTAHTQYIVQYKTDQFKKLTQEDRNAGTEELPKNHPAIPKEADPRFCRLRKDPPNSLFTIDLPNESGHYNMEYLMQNALGFQKMPIDKTEEVIDKRSTFLANPPEVLPIDMKRARFNAFGQPTRKMGTIDLQESFTIAPPYSSEPATYQLKCFAIHEAKEGSTGGHYRAYTLNSDGLWISANDEVITFADQKEFYEDLRNKATFYLYERIH